MKRWFIIFSFIWMILLSGCTQIVPSQDSIIASDIPNDFSFSLVFGVNGISFYDSLSGKLIKTNHATNVEDYITNYQLTEEDKVYFYQLFNDLDLESYPDIYDINKGQTTPSMDLVLTIRMNGKEKTIKAEDIGLSFEVNDEKGQKFLSTCKAIRDFLTQTSKWQLLPEYEFYYD